MIMSYYHNVYVCMYIYIYIYMCVYIHPTYCSNYSTPTFPKVGEAVLGKTIYNNVLSIACFTKPGKVRVGVE